MMFQTIIKRVITIFLLVVGLFTLFIVILLGLRIALQFVFYRNSFESIDFWTSSVSVIISFTIVSFIYFKKLRKVNKHDIPYEKINWSISYVIMLYVFSQFLCHSLKKDLKQYTAKEDIDKWYSQHIIDTNQHILAKRITARIWYKCRICSSILTKSFVIFYAHFQYRCIYNPEAHFSVVTPYFDFHNDSSEIKSENKALKEYFIIVNSENKLDLNSSYQISWAEIGVLKSKKVFFDDIINNYVDEVGGIIEKESEEDSLDYSAKYVSINLIDKKQTIKTKLIYKDKDFFQMTVITKNEFRENKTIDAFFNSFKYLPE